MRQKQEASLTFGGKHFLWASGPLLTRALQWGLVEWVEVALPETSQLLVIFHSSLTCWKQGERPDRVRVWRQTDLGLAKQQQPSHRMTGKQTLSAVAPIPAQSPRMKQSGLIWPSDGPSQTSEPYSPRR